MDRENKPQSEQNNMFLEKMHFLGTQIGIIITFMAMFFGLARVSSLYLGWSSRVKTVVNTGSIVFGILFAIFAVGFVYMSVRLRRYVGKLDSMISYGLIICIQYAMRVGMIGSVQMEEGLYGYYYLRGLAMAPDALISNFIEAGKMTGRISHGYTFFALMGEFLTPGTGYGFQWVQLCLGIAVSLCLFGIVRNLFPRVHVVIAWIAAFVISVQPMFLGFSTMCSIEYGIVSFFIFAFYCYLNRKFILMCFWLIMLSMCKSIGLIMALCFVLGVFASRLAAEIFKITDIEEQDDSLNDDDETSQVDYKNIVIMALVTLVGIAFIAVVRRISMVNGVFLDYNHVKLKLAQLFVLNFSWAWVTVVAIGIVMVYGNKRVKKTNMIKFKPLFILILCYLVHTAYLIFYPKSSLPRYNMLSDLLLVMFGVFLLLKMFVRYRAIVPVFAVGIVCMVIESFVTVDPISAAVFTNVETGGFPLLDTRDFSKDTAVIYDNPGDYSFYNYHYTFVDRAVDKILEDFGWDDEAVLLTAYAGEEMQFKHDDLLWDNISKKRALISGNDATRFNYIGRRNTYEYTLVGDKAKRALVIDSPETGMNTGTSIALLSQYYNVSERMYMDMGHAGKVAYYFLTLK